MKVQNKPGQKLRILHVLDSVQSSSGGPPTTATCLAAAQALKGHDVALLANEASQGQPTAIDRLSDIPGGSGVKVYLCGGGINGVASTLRQSNLREIITRFDVVHLNGVWDIILWRVAAICRSISKPYAITLHGMLHPWSLQQKKLKKAVALAILRRAYLNSAAFLHVGNRIEVEVVKGLQLKAPTAVIPNGIFEDEFQSLPTDQIFRSIVPGLGDTPYLLFLSRLHYKKGLDLLVETFRLLEGRGVDVALVIAGQDDGYQTQLQQKISDYGLHGKIHLVGPLYGESKLSAFSGARAFCLPSRQEGFSMAIVESMAAGVPTVITQAACFPEVEEVGAGLCTPFDPESYADAICAILARPREEFGRHGRSYVHDNLTWPNVAKLTELAYHEFCFSVT